MLLLQYQRLQEWTFDLQQHIKDNYKSKLEAMRREATKELDQKQRKRNFLLKEKE